MTKQEFMAMSLPYGLKCLELQHRGDKNGEIGIFTGYELDMFRIIEDIRMPILRPLSDLIKPCLENDLIPMVELAKMRSGYLHESEFDRYFGKLKMDISTKRLPFDMFQKLVEWHFDIAGLIDKDEAIDYSTLEGFSFKRMA